MSPFLSPTPWEDALKGQEGLLPIDRFICMLLWDGRDTAGLAHIRQRAMANRLGISARHLRDRIAELERRNIVRRLGSDNDGMKIALIGGGMPVSDQAPTAPIVASSAPQQERNQKPTEMPDLSKNWAPRPAAQFRPPEEYKNITPTLEPIISNCVPVPTNLKSPPSPLFVAERAENGTDLLGLPLADDEQALLREAVETWLHWQAKLGKRKRIINLTPKRLRRFTVLWRGPLRRSMTAWRKICRACTRNALLAGVEGRWDGAGFDWVMLEDNAARILRGDFAEDFDPATVVTA